MASSPPDRKRRLLEALPDQPEFVATLDLVWRQAQSSFPGARLGEWLEACHVLAESDVGRDCVVSYVRSAPAIASAAGADAALSIARMVSETATRAGDRAAASLAMVAPRAARRLANGAAFAEWLRVIKIVVAAAPESVTPLLDRSESLLQELGVQGFEAWVLDGVRQGATDPQKRLAFFTRRDQPTLRTASREEDEVSLSDVERQLKAFVMALWHMAPPIRDLPSGAPDRPRRASFAGGIVRLPSSFRGQSRDEASLLYRAAIAHVAAHLQFSRTKFAIGSLKPLQVALISLVEDARVEHLAMRRFPGLGRLWRPFHIATPSGALTAPALMARLARALIDPGYADDNGWIQKGQEMFFAEETRWEDPGISRSIGGLLGNDLGQMRVQFNARTYSVEPAYRDDNQGLWAFDDVSAPVDEQETIFESVRFEREDDAEQPDRERETPEDAADGQEANRAALVEVDAEVGIPVARYPEWDFLIGRERPEWATLVEYEASEGQADAVEDILHRYPVLEQRITKLVRSAKVSRPQRLRRQQEGDRLDLDACIGVAIDQRLGDAPDPRIYARLERRFRDLSVLLLLDVSQSTNDIVPGAGRKVIELEREATALLAHAMAGLGDPFAIHAFCSDTRADVRYYRLKAFDAPYDAAAKRHLAGISGGFSTRMGAALRHAGRELSTRMSYRRLLLIISDGEPSDVDVADRRYLVEDARHAVKSMARLGVDVFCVGLDAGGDNYLTRIFGRRNVLQIDRVERLPEKLSMLYFRLLGS